MLAPNGTPDAIVRKVNADLRMALDDPEVTAKLAANGAFARYMTPGRGHSLRAGGAANLAADPAAGCC